MDFVFLTRTNSGASNEIQVSELKMFCPSNILCMNSYIQEYFAGDRAKGKLTNVIATEPPWEVQSMDFSAWKGRYV